MSQSSSILLVTASARSEASVSRKLADATVEHLRSDGAGPFVVRNVSEGLPFVDEAWVNANFTPADQRTEAHKATLAKSDSLVAELQAADTIVIGTPIYNFGIPATLKAWVDMIARVGITFRYTETGPVGLLEGKRAIVLVASGGTKVGSEIDFATPYLRQALKFVGITDVTFIAADALGQDAEVKLAVAQAQIDTL